jgi:Putative adhesin
VKTRLFLAFVMMLPAIVAAQSPPRPPRPPRPAPTPRVAPVPPVAPVAPVPPADFEWPEIPEVTEEMLRGLDEETRQMVKEEIRRAREELKRAKVEYKDAMKEAGRAQRDAMKDHARAQREAERAQREAERAQPDWDWNDDDDDDNDFDDDDWDDHDWSDAKPSGPGTKTFPVTGPANLEISAGQADVIVRSAPKAQVSITTPGCARGGAAIDHSGSSVEIAVPWGCTGKIIIEAPVGTRVEASGGEGSLQLDGQFGDVEVQTVGGAIRVGKARNVEAQSVNGSVTLLGVGGRAEVESVAGKVSVVTLDPAARVEIETVSGAIDWRGPCNAGCRVEARTMSGNMTVGARAGSSYAFGFATRSGSFQPPAFLKVDERKVQGSRTRIQGKVGNGDGQIRVMTHSGQASLAQN